MIRRIDFDVDDNTAQEMQGFFSSRGLSPRSSVSFCGSISIPGGFSLSWDPEKDPRTIPNLVEAIFDAIEIFINRINGIKVDGKEYNADYAKVILAKSFAKVESPFEQFEKNKLK